MGLPCLLTELSNKAVSSFKSSALGIAYINDSGLHVHQSRTPNIALEDLVINDIYIEDEARENVLFYELGLSEVIVGYKNKLKTMGSPLGERTLIDGPYSNVLVDSNNFLFFEGSQNGIGSSPTNIGHSGGVLVHDDTDNTYKLFSSRAPSTSIDMCGGIISLEEDIKDKAGIYKDAFNFGCQSMIYAFQNGQFLPLFDGDGLGQFSYNTSPETIIYSPFYLDLNDVDNDGISNSAELLISPPDSQQGRISRGTLDMFLFDSDGDLLGDNFEQMFGDNWNAFQRYSSSDGGVIDSLGDINKNGTEDFLEQ